MKRRTRKIVASLWATAALLLASSSADAILASIKSTGMAATATAYPQDSLVVAYNPAGLVDVPDRVDLEGAWDHTKQSSAIIGNLVPARNGSFDASKTKDFYLAGFGVKKCIPWNMALGLAVYNRNFVKTTYTTPVVLLGTTRPGLEYVHEVIAPSWAIRLWKCHSLGIALNVNLQRFKVNGIQNFDSAVFSSAPGFVTNNGYNWSSGVGVTIGWLSRFFCDKLKIGVAYTPYTHMSKFRKYRGFYAQGGKFDLPQRWNAGISYRWIPCSVVAFDVEYVDWNQIKALHNPLAANLILDKLGTTNGTGFGFRRQIFYRVGIDYTLYDCLTLRLGFRHANRPFKNTQTAANALLCETVQNFVTCGFTWYYRCFELTGLYAHGFEKTVKGQNSIPALLGGGNVNLKQRKDIVGVALAYNF